MTGRNSATPASVVAVVLIVGGMLTFSAAAYSRGNKAITPLNGKTVTVNVDGRQRKYYLLTKSTPVRVRIDGPVKAEILTRLTLTGDQSGVVQYSIEVLEGKTVVKKYTTSSGASNASFVSRDGVPARSRKFSLLVPEGSHTYDLLLEDTGNSEAILRLEAASADDASHREKESRIEPLSYARIVTVKNKNKLITYYVCSLKQSIELRVIGETHVDIDARLNFDSHMQGEQKYAITVWEGLNRIASAPFTTTKATGASFTDWKEMAPGRLNTLSFNVPKGEHLYHIALMESNAPSVSMKFSIPERDLKNAQ